MKKIIFSILSVTGSLFFSANSLFAQQQHRCGTDEAMEQLFKNDPEAKQRYMAQQQHQQEVDRLHEQNKASARQRSTYVFDTIPVVFHVLHENGGENIPDDVIKTALEKVNLDYQKMAADTGDIRPVFKGIAGATNIVFKLATKDYLGNCTNGIIRYFDPIRTKWDRDNLSMTYLFTHTTSAKWKTSKYLNIYLVKDIPSSGGGTVVGYTYLAGTFSTNAAQDAIVFNSGFIASDWRSLAHEMGHWLGLNHTFNDPAHPNQAGVYCGDDNISDTPPTKGYFSTCPNVGRINDCGTTNIEENYQNIMDYSSCPKNFTEGQVTVMRDVLTTVSSRITLVSDANMVATGIWNSPSPCKPITDFSPLFFSTICEGSSVTFTDVSTNGPVTTRSWSFPGGTPATDTNNTVAVTYNTAGVYDVFLQSGNGNGSDTALKKARVIVTQNSSVRQPTYTMGFESTDTISNITTINQNQDANYKWATTTAAAYSGTTSYKMSAYGIVAPGLIDEFILPAINLKDYTSISLSFKMAYRAKSANSTDQLRVLVSTDCGQSWTPRYSKLSGTLSTVSGYLTTAFTPAAGTANWRTETFSIPTSFAEEDVRIKFEFTSGAVDFSGSSTPVTASNNLYIDDINITGTKTVAPIADFSATPLSVSAWSNVTFSDLSTGTPTTWTWSASPDAGVTFSNASAKNPTATFANAGTYDITLIAANGVGTNTATKTAYITVTAGDGFNELFKQKANLKVVPNPMTSSSEISFNIESPVQNASVIIYNVLGEKVATVYDGSLTKGKFSYPVNKTNIPASGIYFVKLNADGNETVAKITVQ